MTAFSPANPINIMDMFNGQSGALSSRSSILDNSITQSQTPMTAVSGRNFVAELPEVDLGPMKPNATNHVSNLPDLKTDALTTRTQVASVAANYVAEVGKVQNTMDAAMKPGAANLGIDLSQAQQTIIPSPQTTHADAVFTMGTNAVAGGPVVSALQAVSEIKQERGRLTAEQEGKLLDEMRAQLSPQRDAMGNVVAPAKIPSDYDVAALSNEEMKALYMPPEQQPEGQQIFAMLHTLDEDILPGLRHAETRKNNYEGDKFDKAVARGDMEAATIMLDGDVDQAREAIAAVHGDEPPLRAEDVNLWSDSLAFTSLPTTENVQLDVEVKAALASLDREMVIKPELDNQFKLAQGGFAA